MKSYSRKKKRKGGISNKKFPLTKSLGELMKDEDGFVTKKTILKVGLSTIAALGMTGALTDISSGATTTHTNVVSVGPLDSCANHTNITTHSSY